MKLPRVFGPPPSDTRSLPHFYCPTCRGIRFVRFDGIMEDEVYGKESKACCIIASCIWCGEILDTVADKETLKKKFDKFSAG